jgi:hypothetical protein
MNLLQAIKQWNLKKRPCHESSPPQIDDGEDASASFTSATIGGSHTGTDYDTITAVSTSTSTKGGFTASYSTAGGAKSGLPKTPLCNYSSRPSFLTARILRDNDLLPVSIGSDSLYNANNGVETVGGDEKGSESCLLLETKDVSQRPIVGKPFKFQKDTVTANKDLVGPSSSSSSSLVVVPPQEENMECHAAALDLLRQTAAELGLAKEELGAVLPTVQKLVKVITQHVPRLENFVEQVCETVLESEKGHDHHGTPLGKKGHVSKKRSRKNIKARKERMEDALCVLKNGWQKDGPCTKGGGGRRLAGEERIKINDNTHTGLNCRLDVNGEHIVEHENVVVPKGSLFPYTDYQSYGEFTMQVKEQLAKHGRHSYLSHTRRDVSLGSNHQGSPTPLLTDAEALEELKRLIEFEDKYNRKMNHWIHHDGREEEEGGKEGEHEESCSLATSNGGNNGSQTRQGDTVLQDLLRADTTTLRRFVLHFAYLFEVRQDFILEKMNDLYVFSHEATSLIQDIKKCLNLSEDCSIHCVARQVMTRIQNKQS